MKDNFTIKLTEENTGRSHEHFNSENPISNKEKLILDNSAVCYSTLTELISNLLRESLAGVEKVQDLQNRQFYRGLSKECISKFNLKMLGPNPCRKKEGRYHSIGQKALYLISNRAHIAKEIETEEYGYQAFILKQCCNIKIADLSSRAKLPDLLSRALSISESGLVSDQTLLRPKYAFSQFLANLLREEWDGMLIPGVHGGDCNYENLCIFEPALDKWTQWAQGKVLYLSPSAPQ